MPIQRALLAFAAFTLISCSPLEAKPDGRADLETIVHAQSNGLLKIVSYKKTNGIDYTAPVKAYEVQYEVEVEFVSDAYWKAPGIAGWDGRYCALKGKPNPFSFGPDTFSYQPVKSGTRMRFKGSLTYQMTDNGWRTTYPPC